MQGRAARADDVQPEPVNIISSYYRTYYVVLEDGRCVEQL